MLKSSSKIKNKNSSEFQAGAGAASHMFCLLVLRDNKPVDFSRYFTQFAAVFSSTVRNITCSENRIQSPIPSSW